VQYWTTEMEKQVGERVQAVLTNPHLLSVFQKFGPAVFRRSSVFHGLGTFLSQQNVRGECCFEVGSWNGLTAVVLSRFFDRVVTVDIAHNPMRHEIVSHLGITNIQFIDIADNDEKASVAKRTKFDFAYLDGDHANDTGLDWELTKHCKRVLFHEVWPFQKPVWDLVQQLPDHQVTYGGAGLALWEGRK
jgi:hypothetical protein